ncbi:MAG: hypothetical protein MH252_03635 [Thermosynechococcaceae cyanobacterium MS004]|nr:hypothetical protein [Thermosynechococcaceae cyanobacterium MS004]
MSEKFSFTFKRAFRGGSLPGITFHWLKCTYVQGVEDAIANAVRTVYAPLALAETAGRSSRVLPSVNRSRAMFHEMMLLSKDAPEVRKPIAERVNISFSKKMDPTSIDGEVFEWLTRSYGKKAVKFAIHAVCLVYSPAALAGATKNKDEAWLQARRSRLVFEDMMSYVIAQADVDETEFLANRLNRTFMESAIEEKWNKPIPETGAGAGQNPVPKNPVVEQELSASSQPETVEAAEASGTGFDDDFDDDFVPIEYDLDFGN